MATCLAGGMRITSEKWAERQYQILMELAVSLSTNAAKCLPTEVHMQRDVSKSITPERHSHIWLHCHSWWFIETHN
jgi:hypothetical protein